MKKTKKTTVKKAVPVRSNSIEGLRDTLLDTIIDVRAGTIEPPRANSISKLCGQVVNTVRVEMEYIGFMNNVQKKQSNNKKTIGFIK